MEPWAGESERTPGWGRAAAAGLLGAALLAALLALATQVLRPGVGPLTFGAPAVAAVAAGVLVGILEPRRPLVAAGGCAVAVWILLTSWPPVSRSLPLPVQAAMCPGLLLGSMVGMLAQQRGRRATMWTGVALAAVYAAVFVWPTVTFPGRARAFVAYQQPALRSYLARRLPPAPDRLEWRWQLLRTPLRVVQLSTGWEVAPAAGVPAGRVKLVMQVVGPPQRRLRGADITYLDAYYWPAERQQLKSVGAAAQYAHDLGLKNYLKTNFFISSGRPAAGRGFWYTEWNETTGRWGLWVWPSGELAASVGQPVR